MQKYHTKKHCRLCASDNLSFVYSMGMSPIGEDFVTADKLDYEQHSYPVTLMRCLCCGNLQLGEVVSKEDLYNDYLYFTTRSLGLDKHFTAYATQLQKLLSSSAVFAVDIGSNAGTLLYAMQQEGFSVLGVEPAPHIAKQAQANGQPTVCGFFDIEIASSIVSQYGQADFITSNNCFANIDDLDVIMQGVNTLLSEEGYFVVETGYALDLIQNFVIDNIYHEHLSYFLVKPLQTFFHKYDFEIAHVERIPTKGGSIRVFAKRRRILKEAPWEVQALINYEIELGFATDAPYKRFAQCAEARRLAIYEYVKKLAQKGKIAAFGAAVGCTALSYWANIVDYIDFFVDDNELMQGRFSPGKHIPIYAPNVLYEKRPYALLVLPWRYFAHIQKRHVAYSAQGGKMVNLLMKF